jgi:hypothetical protein
MHSWVRKAIATSEVLLALACASKREPAMGPVGTSHVDAKDPEGAVSFTYDSLDARPVSSFALRGKPTVMAFVTTYDLGCQAQVNYLVAMAKNDGDKTNYALVALEKREERELVEVYRTNLGVTFPVALADEPTIAGSGPLGDVHKIPTVVVLDRSSRIAWKKTGLAKSDEIRAALRGL